MIRRAHPPHCAIKGDSGPNASRARWLWEHSLPVLGTPVERYLAARAIVATEAIRYLPAKPQHPHPAMIVPFAVPKEPEPGRLVIPSASVTAVDLKCYVPIGQERLHVNRTKNASASQCGDTWDPSR